MPKFLVGGEITISMHTIVEAETVEEAKEIASQRPLMSLCWSCSDSKEADQEWRTSGELDGEVTIREDENGVEEYEEE